MSDYKVRKMSETKDSLAGIYTEFNEFIESHQSVIMATINTLNEPESSYAPVLKHNGNYYVYVSELSKHTANLMDHPLASLLFIEPENDAKNLFARKRATLKVTAKHIARTANNWEEMLELLENKFGKIISMLKPLEDFHLFELTPVSAGYVRGFAQAYKLEGKSLSEVTHLNEGGHGKSKK